MDKKNIKLYDVLGEADLPDLSVEQVPADGDPIEVDGEMYFVCERDLADEPQPSIGVIPLVVRHPSRVSNIKEYVKCLSKAHRRVLFKNKKGETDLEHSDEMVIL
jgi:hypothetical protein